MTDLTREVIREVLSKRCACGHLALNHRGNEGGGCCPTCFGFWTDGYCDDPCQRSLHEAFESTHTREPETQDDDSTDLEESA